MWVVYIRVRDSFIDFGANRSFFGEKMSKWASLLKKWAIRSFLVSNLSDSLTMLIFGERPERFAHIALLKRGNERIACFFKLTKKRTKWTIKYDYSNIFNFLSESQKNEQSEQILHSRSFHLSDLSEWANKRIPNPGWHLYAAGSDWLISVCCRLWLVDIWML